jgi:Tfp pilus assembly protein PilN
VLFWITSTGKHIIIIVNFILIAAFLSRFYFDRVLSDLNESLKVKAEILKQMAPFEKKYVSVAKKISQIEKLKKGQALTLFDFEETLALIPPGIKLSSYKQIGKTISFSAHAASKDILKLLINNLKSASRVQTVNLKRVEKQSVKDQEINAAFEVLLI